MFFFAKKAPNNLGYKNRVCKQKVTRNDTPNV